MQATVRAVHLNELLMRLRATMTLPSLLFIRMHPYVCLAIPDKLVMDI